MPAVVDKPAEGFPLAWPVAQRRQDSRYRRNAEWIYKLGFGRYRDHLIAELISLGADPSSIIISSDLPVRLDGLPYASYREPADPGVAVYFTRDDAPYVLACDRYTQVKANMAGLGKVVEALRAIERHGSPQLMAQAMGGFKMLPAHEANESWWVVLGVDSTATAEDVERAHRRLAERNHPDAGGTDAEMARINAARDRALRDVGGG